MDLSQRAGGMHADGGFPDRRTWLPSQCSLARAPAVLVVVEVRQDKPSVHTPAPPVKWLWFVYMCVGFVWDGEESN